MQLGETIATYDVDLALRGETGKFEVKSPDGETHYVTCRSNAIMKTEKPSPEIYPGAFFIRKIAELVTTEKTDANPPAARCGNQVSASTPFLLENREAGMAGTHASSGVGMADHDQNNRLCQLDLSYSTSEKKPDEPRAFVYVKTGPGQPAGLNGRLLLTAECASYTELDAEIRKLQAELDDICLRAKKNFYKARAAASA
jgi:hypothetical protein